MAEIKDKVKKAIDAGAAKAKKTTDKVSAGAKNVAKTVGKKVEDAGAKIRKQGS